MGYLDDSSGPQLVPPIPDLTPFLNRRPGFGLIWNGDLARTVRYADRYQIPEELVPYFVDHPERYFEYREVNRIPSDFDYYFPPYRSDELDIHRRSVYWTLALFIVAHELLNQAILPPGYPLDVAVGYLDPHNEVDAFGLAISVDPEDMSYAILPPEPTHLYSLPIVRDRHVRLPLLYGWPDQEGPVIVRRPREYVELHAPPGFGGASSASYVRDATTGTPLGLLGCRHVLPLPKLGAGVPVSGFPAQKVTAISGDLDIAVVSSPTPVPAIPRLVQRWPAQYLPCHIDGIVSSLNTRVADISNTWGVFTDPRMPVHVDLEHCGQHGDSGAAVLDISSGSVGGVIGVYRGAINNQGPTKARSVHIQQVEKVMKLELVR